MYRLIYTPESVNDMEEANEWYEDKQKGLGSEFSETIIDYLEYLSRNAHSHPIIRGEYRELVVKRFPYVIVYNLINEKQVMIVGIIHTSKHPSKRWKRK